MGVVRSKTGDNHVTQLY